MEVLVLVLSFVILLVIGVPIAFSIGIAGILTMLMSINALPAFTTYAHRMATGLDSFALLAIPFFVLAGFIMNRGGYCTETDQFCTGPCGKPTCRSGFCECHCQHVVWRHFRIRCCCNLCHRKHYGAGDEKRRIR